MVVDDPNSKEKINAIMDGKTTRPLIMAPPFYLVILIPEQNNGKSQSNCTSRGRNVEFFQRKKLASLAEKLYTLLLDYKTVQQKL